MKIKFYHLHRKVDDHGNWIQNIPDPRCHGGRITIAIDLETIGNDHSIPFGIAFCSPEDVYNKQEGQKLSADRLTSDPDYIQDVKKKRGISQNNEILLNILLATFAAGTFPNWSRTLIVEAIQGASSKLFKTDKNFQYDQAPYFRVTTK